MPGPDADLVHRPLTRAFSQLVRSFPGGVFEEHGDFAVGRCADLPIPGAHGILDHGRAEEPVASALEPTLSSLADDGARPWVVTFDDRRVVLSEASRLGLVGDHGNAGMVLERASFRPAVAPPGAELSAAEDDTDLAVANATFAEAFDVPIELFAPLYRASFFAETPGRVVLVRDAGTPVATAISWPTEDAVGIFSVATPSRFRGRGFGAVATSAAVELGFGAGARSAFLQSSAMGEGVYRRLGFREVSRYVVLTAP